ncbi:MULTISPECIES: hypothetical protein [unclassified Streptomyces]|uniref:hypothetical protein n=1 Tax=unclassified Streptomyces TaxID=2593676 RepID=UPI002DD7F486|nr:hypothetical protein [Streptomyces sp. NBC_01445]WSE02653.1 hypothetical protein OG574_04205 [Streptomyces sp. NBC_01445]
MRISYEIGNSLVARARTKIDVDQRLLRGIALPVTLLEAVRATPSELGNADAHPPLDVV